MFRKILESLKMKVKFNQEIIFVSEIPSYSAFKKEEKKINLSWFCSCLVFWLIIIHQSKNKLLIFSVGKADLSTKHFNNKLKLKCVKRENMLKYVHCCCLAYKLCPALLRPCRLQPARFLCLGFSRQEYWSGLPFPPPGGSSWLRDWTHASCLAGRFFTTEPLSVRKPLSMCIYHQRFESM